METFFCRSDNFNIIERTGPNLGTGHQTALKVWTLRDDTTLWGCSSTNARFMCLRFTILFVTKINLSSFAISTNVWLLVVSLFFKFELLLDYIINLLNFIGMYKFCKKFDFYKFI
jgi:hypothetical protein